MDDQTAMVDAPGYRAGIPSAQAVFKPPLRLAPETSLRLAQSDRAYAVTQAARTGRTLPSPIPGYRADRKHGVLILPKASGRPGFIAIFQNQTCPQSGQDILLTKSASPTDTPPEVITASALSAAS